MELPVQNFDYYSWVVLPFLIFAARVVDVSLGTLRIIFLSRGKRYLAPILGFVEVLIWIIAVSQLVNNLSNIAGFLAYAGGFAAGNYIGLLIESKLALGMLSIRIITIKNTADLVEQLHSAGYGVTAIDAEGFTGKVKVLYTIINRKDLDDVLAIIRSKIPQAFLSIEEVRSASEGIFRHRDPGWRQQLRVIMRGLRK
jgi:uncharacterized protein YebE (UPF0316 family)